MVYGLGDFPWALSTGGAAAARRSAVRRGAQVLLGTAHPQVRSSATARGARGATPVESPLTISCGVPGHDRPGEELRTETMQVNDSPLIWGVQARCGFATSFGAARNAEALRPEALGMRQPSRVVLALVTAAALGAALAAQSPVQSCNASPKPAWCAAVPGDRTQGWLLQRRSEVMARNGIVATSQPLAAQVGVDILKKGGNAIDAAVATAATLSVIEPMNVGPGGDLFLIVYIAPREPPLRAQRQRQGAQRPDGRAHERARLPLGCEGLGSGIRDAVARHSHRHRCPAPRGGWQEVLSRFGTMTFKDTLQPAIDYAEQGFPVSERIAFDWTLPNAVGPVADDPRRCCTVRDQDAVNTWYVNGQKPAAGQIVRNPGLARTFRLLQQQGRDAFYRGEIARALVAKSASLGGSMTMDDLATYAGEWVTPATTSYHGYDVFTLPPPAQTWATDEILNILEVCMPVWSPGQTLATLGPASAKYWHFVVEAKKLAFQDLYTYNADPNFATVPLDRLLSKAHAKSLCARVNPDARLHAGGGHPGRHRRRHHRAHRGRPRRQHGGVGQQPLFVVRLRRDRAGVRDLAAQPRRPLHARPEEPQRHRAAEAPVQHAVRGLRDAEHAATHGRHADGW